MRGTKVYKWFYETAVDEDDVVYMIDFGNRQFTEYGVIISEKSF